MRHALGHLTPKGNAMFAITNHRGFHIKFANGYTVSVQFGAGHRCDNFNDSFHAASQSEWYKSGDAEVAVIRPDGKLAYLSEYDQPLSHQTPEQVAALIAGVCMGVFTEYNEPSFDDVE